MRTKFFIVAIIILLFFTPFTFAQDNSDIEQFKDKLASKVAELQKKDEKAISGFITEIKEKEIRFKTKENEIYTGELDDVLTKFYSLKSGIKKEITIEDLSKDDNIIVTGPINGKIITANNIYLDTSYLSDSGVVSEVNQSEFYIKVSLLKNETVTLDIETLTKKLAVNLKSFNLEPIGFSKIKSGDTVHFIYENTNSSKTEKRYSAEKIIVIPQEYFSE